MKVSGPISPILPLKLVAMAMFLDQSRKENRLNNLRQNIGRLKMADLNMTDGKKHAVENGRREKGKPRNRDMKLADLKMADLS